MKTRRPILAMLSTLLILSACGDDDGGGDDGGDGPSVDAGPGGGADLEALGALCGVNQDVCPDEAPTCLVFEESTSLVGFCSAVCISDGTFQTDEASQIVGVDPPLATGDATCAPLYTGPLGVPRCGATVDVSPPLPLEPSTSYTFSASCVIDCGPGGLCPGELTCDAQRGYCVAP